MAAMRYFKNFLAVVCACCNDQVVFQYTSHMFENLCFAVEFRQVVLQSCSSRELATCFEDLVFHQVVLQLWNYHIFEDLCYSIVFCQVELQLGTYHMFWRPQLCSRVVFCQVVLQSWTYNKFWRRPLCYTCICLGVILPKEDTLKLCVNVIENLMQLLIDIY